jgi:hypothetical protein
MRTSPAQRPSSTSEPVVPTLSGLDSSALQVLRAKLEAISEVEAVLIDETSGAIHLVCEPNAAAPPILRAASEAMVTVGVDNESVVVETVVRTSGVTRHRVRFLTAERILEPDHRIRVKVTLEWNGETKTGEAIGDNGEYIELRTAALAAVNALEAVTGEDLGVRVVGVKQVRAFDSELMVVSMHRAAQNPQRLVGAVPGGRDPRAAAAIAVLNGLNRTLGNYLSVG